jgi:ABC-type multidrug transport system ATPase subunit
MTGPSSGPAVAARGLVCQFGPVRAVDDLSFEVAEGEVFGLLGPNGAGKTTVIRVVTTLLRPAAGTMRVFGTVLLTTHYMEEAERLCDRVGLLLDGRLRAIGRPRELEAALGPEATLEDVFRAYAADGPEEDKEGLRDVRSTRRTAGRLR